jgi:thiol-disulfide isomerase/thioredoxin
MKLRLLMLLFCITLTACKTTSTDSEHPKDRNARFDRHMDAQGPITIEELQSNYAIFAVKRTNVPSPDSIYYLNQVAEPTTITAFFGTWCHDSQREIPELIKLKKALDNPNIRLKLIALDRQKKDSQGLAEQAKVKYTPTITVSQKGKELGRIVEQTTQYIGAELVDIIKSSSGSSEE